MLTIAHAFRQKLMHWPKRIKIVLALLGLLAGQALPMYVALAHANAVSDTTPVTVHSFTASTNTVNVDAASMAVDLSGTVSDDLSGFASMQVFYTSPSGQQVAEGQVMSVSANTFDARVTFPRNAESGTWEPTASFSDASTNVADFTATQLTERGFVLAVNVISSTPDITAPTVSSVEYGTSDLIDVTPGRGQLAMSVRVADDMTGYNNGIVKYISPSGSQSVSANFESTTEDGLFNVSVEFPMNIESGKWLMQMTLVDNASNTRVYDADELYGMGLPNSADITSDPDTTPVSVSSLEFASINEHQYVPPFGGAVFSFKLELNDNLAGPETPDVIFRSVSSTQTAPADMYVVYNDGLTMDIEAYVVLPMYAAEGEWVPEISTADSAGNQRTYSYGDLVALGYNLQITIGTSVTSPVTPGQTVTTDENGTGVSEETPVQAALTSPTSGEVSIVQTETASENADFGGYALFDQQFSINAPSATDTEPLVLSFTIDSSQLDGIDPTDITIFRDGDMVGQCPGSTTANPDPCVTSATTNAEGDATITVNSTHASRWTLGVENAQQGSFSFDKFKKPIQAAPALNKDKAGSAIPVKFSVGGDYGMDILSSAPQSQRINCTSLQSIGEATDTVASNDKDLKYTKNGFYKYNWKTLKQWNNTCRKFVLHFTNGETAAAYFKF